jgi:hypothetical protein
MAALESDTNFKPPGHLLPHLVAKDITTVQWDKP